MSEPAINLTELVVSMPDTLHGQPRIRGTRVPVSVILDCLVAGMSQDEILRQYPTLPAHAIAASLTFAASLTPGEIVPPTSDG